jgi:4-hydroxybenzoate polyprenyltransferase
MPSSNSVLQWVSALLAFVVVGTFCFIVAFDAVQGKPFSVPDAFIVLVSTIAGVLFGSRATANGNSATVGQLVAALQQSTPVSTMQATPKA